MKYLSGLMLAALLVLIIPLTAGAASTAGTVPVTYLIEEGATGLRPMGEGQLLFSGRDMTTLTLLTGDALRPDASRVLSFRLSAECPSVRIGASGLSYYDPVQRQTCILGPSLQLLKTVPAPGGLTGVPVLSGDGQTLYYCTRDAVRALDLETGIRRVLKSAAFDSQQVLGLYCGDRVLGCLIQDGDRQRQLYLSTDTGALLAEADPSLTLQAPQDHYIAAWQENGQYVLAFGQEAPQELAPEEAAIRPWLFPQQGKVITAAAEHAGISLAAYDLNSGRRTSMLTLSGQQLPVQISPEADGSFLLLFSEGDHSSLLRWWPQHTPVSDPNGYAFPYSTAEHPDNQGLEQCREYGARLGDRLGIRIFTGPEAAAVQPWDYDLEPEYRPGILMRQLRTLEKQLAQYPQGMLPTTADHFSGLNLCLVKRLTGTAESGSLQGVNGLQFHQGTDAYIALTAGSGAEQALHHELFHVMETHILSASSALDRWQELNPRGFLYDYDYAVNALRNSGIYLSEKNRAFVDTYSMSFPKEDRARIMEYAMLPGQEVVFTTSWMQAKLRALCRGLREAYGLDGPMGSYPWEQYLR